MRKEWDWRETVTQHRPGIQPADVTELLEKGAKVLILTQGMSMIYKSTEKDKLLYLE